MRQVFLDHQSSTPVLPEVFEAMRPYFTERFGSASSLHAQGLRARDALNQARAQFAAFLHAESPEEIIFTSGGTEAVNLAVKGAALAGKRVGDHIVLSNIEHPAVMNSVEWLEKQGFTATRVPVDAQGRVNPEAVRAALTDKTILICLHHANYDIGTVQPLREAGQLAAERGIPFFVDAVMSAGWLPLDVQALGASLVALAPHRFYGPKGVGVLYRARRARIENLLHGGVQEEGRRPGTQNIPAIVGAGVAAELAQRDLPSRQSHTGAMQRRLWEGLHLRVRPLQLNGPLPGEQRLVTNLNVSIEFIEGEAVVLRGDLKGIALASGTACVTKSLKVSPVLEAIGLDRSLAQGSILLSPGKDNTPDDIDYAVATLAQVVDDLRHLSPTWDDYLRGTIKSLIPRAG